MAKKHIDKRTDNKEMPTLDSNLHELINKYWKEIGVVVAFAFAALAAHGVLT